MTQTSGGSILADPWASGKIFNDSWALYSPPAEVDYSKVDFIWISHEHPDHFNIPTLRSIPDRHKKRIRVLYQRHASPRITDAIQQLGFPNAQDLRLNRWLPLGGSAELYCGSVGNKDSYLAIRDGDTCILNLNDCVHTPSLMRSIKQKIGEITLLFCQFSFASWVGNSHDLKGAAKNKERELKEKIEIFQPDHLIPFASFIYFCNEENARMNAWVNTPRRIMDLGLPRLEFMYPGDSWDAKGGGFDSERAAARYEEDLENLAIDPRPEPVSDPELCKAIQTHLQRFRGPLSRLLFLSSKAFHIHVHDVGKIIEVDPRKLSYSVTEATPDAAEEARYEMCSQAAWYAFAYPWGWSTLNISGMYTDRSPGRASFDWFVVLTSLVSAEVFRMGSFSQIGRTLEFLWNKRAEIATRLRDSGSKRDLAIDV